MRLLPGVLTVSRRHIFWRFAMKKVISWLALADKHANIISFSLFHVLSLALVPFFEFSLLNVLMCFVCYYMRMFGITAGYHRYHSHKSFETSRLVSFLLACLACMAMQKGPLWWSRKHRNHHRYSDQEGDPHSPWINTIWHAHVGWLFSRQEDEDSFQGVGDLAKWWELRWLNYLNWVPGICLALACYGMNGFGGVLWGFLISTVLLYHGTFLVNSACHLFGMKRFATNDESRDNWWVALFFTLGEGWHRGHHAKPARARHGYFWWELDVTYYILWVMSLFGLVWKLYKPPPKMVKISKTS